MAEFPLTNTAQEVDDAIQAVVDAPNNSITSGSNELVTAGTIHQEITTLDESNLDSGFLVTEAEGIASNDTDTQIPTCAAVKDYSDNSKASLGTYSSVGTSGTAASDGFLVVSGSSSAGITLTAIVDGETFTQAYDFTSGTKTFTMTLPVASGMSWSVSGGTARFISLS